MKRLAIVSTVIAMIGCVVFVLSGMYLWLLWAFPAPDAPTYEDQLTLQIITISWFLLVALFGGFFLRWFISSLRRELKSRADRHTGQA